MLDILLPDITAAPVIVEQGKRAGVWVVMVAQYENGSVAEIPGHKTM